MSATTIEDYASKYNEITEFSYNDNIIIMDSAERELYQYIAIRYSSLKDYIYEFNNFNERYLSHSTLSLFSRPHLI